MTIEGWREGKRKQKWWWMEEGGNRVRDRRIQEASRDVVGIEA
jgi:hypothetical protein